MEKRQLPVKKRPVGFVVYGSLALALVVLCQLSLMSLALSSLLAGDFVLAFTYVAFSLFYLWASGSFYISLPLTIYFHRNYYRVAN